MKRFGKFAERKYPYPQPEWTPENINRKKGDTTFELCGWCEYASGGLGRYHCLIATSCSLLPDYGLGTDLYWDTPCIVQMIGQIDFKHITKSKQYEIESYQHRIKRTEDEIQVIAGLDLRSKPPLPEYRVDDYNEGEVVWVFHKSKWERAVVVPGYRSHDGCVSFILDNYPESKPGKEPWGCGAAVPTVLKDWEYQYFKGHPEDFRNWLDLCDREYNGEKVALDRCYEAMRG